jgi:Immunoglobulin domain/Immunoglobulin I-set domain
MKKLILAFAILASTGGVFAQGWVTLGGVDIVYTNMTSCQAGGARGLTPGNNSYIYRLFIAPYGTTDPEAFTDTGVGASDIMPGGIYGQTPQVPGWPVGGVMNYLIRGWSINLGYDWPTVKNLRDNGWQGAPANLFYGESEIGSADACDCGSYIPSSHNYCDSAVCQLPFSPFDLYACCHPMLPLGVTGPTNVTVSVGGTAVFAVTTTGGFLHYAWYKGGTPLTDGPTAYGSVYSGTRTATLRISNASTNDSVSAANGFSCRVKNYSGTIDSGRAGLNVEPPSINLRIYADQLLNGFDDWSWNCLRDWGANDPHTGFRSAMFSVTDQWGALWFHHTDLDTSGYTNLSFWIKGDAFTGQELQVGAVLGNYWPTARPLNITNNWAWQKMTYSLLELGAASQTNFNGFVIQDAGSAGDLIYVVDDVQLETAFPDGRPTIAAHPASKTVNSGANVTFSVLASGAETLVYRWRLNNTNVAGGTGSTLLVSDVQPAKAGAYTALVSNLVGSVTSRVATLALSVPLTILVNDGSMGVISNQFGFNISGNAGDVVVVEGSYDLVTWTPLSTNTLGSVPFHFSDPQSAMLTSRYYRVRLQ